MNAAHLNQRIAKSFCFRPLTDDLARKSNAPLGGPHFGSNSPVYGAYNASQMPGNCPGGGGGGMGGFGNPVHYSTTIINPMGKKSRCKLSGTQTSYRYVPSLYYKTTFLIVGQLTYNHKRNNICGSSSVRNICFH